LLVDPESALPAFAEAARIAAPGSLLEARIQARAALLTRTSAPEPARARLARAGLSDARGAAPSGPPDERSAEIARLVRAARTASRIARRYPREGAADALRGRRIVELA